MSTYNLARRVMRRASSVDGELPVQKAIQEHGPPVVVRRCTVGRLIADDRRPSPRGQSHGFGDEDINTIDTSTPSSGSTPSSATTESTPAGPITRTRARQLNYQVSAFLNSCPSYFNHGDTCTLVFLRNDGEDKKGRGVTGAGFGLQNSATL